MEIKHERSWRTGNYEEVVIRDCNVELRSGLLDKNEARELAQNLRIVADNLDPEGDT